MFINIVLTTMAADPAIALKPRDYLFPVGFWLRHGRRFARKYMRIGDSCQINAQLIAQSVAGKFLRFAKSARADFFSSRAPGCATD